MRNYAIAKCYVEFLSAGVFTSDTSEIQIDSYASNFDIPDNCFGYRFYTIIEVEVSNSGTVEIAKTKKLNQTGIHYIDGKYFSQQEAIWKYEHDKNMETMLSNLVGNGYDLVINRFGGFNFFGKDDKIVNK